MHHKRLVRSVWWVNCWSYLLARVFDQVSLRLSSSREGWTGYWSVSRDVGVLASPNE